MPRDSDLLDLQRWPTIGNPVISTKDVENFIYRVIFTKDVENFIYLDEILNMPSKSIQKSMTVHSFLNLTDGTYSIISMKNNKCKLDEDFVNLYALLTMHIQKIKKCMTMHNF